MHSIFSDVVGAAIWRMIEALLGAASKHAGEAVVNGIKKSLSESRAELNAFIVTLGNQQAFRNYTAWRHARQIHAPRPYAPYTPYEPGSEATYIQLLTKLYEGLSAPDEQKVRKETFRFILHLTPQEFDEFLPGLEHDVVLQRLKQLAVILRKVAPYALGATTFAVAILGTLVRKTVNMVGDGADELTEGVQQVRERFGLRRL